MFLIVSEFSNETVELVDTVSKLIKFNWTRCTDELMLPSSVIIVIKMQFMWHMQLVFWRNVTYRCQRPLAIARNRQYFYRTLYRFCLPNKASSAAKIPWSFRSNTFSDWCTLSNFHEFMVKNGWCDGDRMWYHWFPNHIKISTELDVLGSNNRQTTECCSCIGSSCVSVLCSF